MAKILIIDDEQMVLRVAAAILRNAGHEVRESTTPRGGLEIARDEQDIDLLITNHFIAPVSGRVIAEWLQRYHPALKVIHVSGWPQSQLEKEGSLTPGSIFVQKPFRPADLLGAVERLLT